MNIKGHLHVHGIQAKYMYINTYTTSPTDGPVYCYLAGYISSHSPSLIIKDGPSILAEGNQQSLAYWLKVTNKAQHTG